MPPRLVAAQVPAVSAKHARRYPPGVGACSPAMGEVAQPKEPRAAVVMVVKEKKKRLHTCEGIIPLSKDETPAGPHGWRKAAAWDSSALKPLV